MAVLKNDMMKKIVQYKGLIFLLILEGLFVLLAVIGLGKDQKVATIPMDQLKVTSGSYVEDRAGYYIDTTSAYNGVFLETPGISLSRGVYEVRVTYEADVAGAMSMVDTGVAYNSLLGNTINLFPGLTKTDASMWLLSDTDTFLLQFSYSGEGYLLIQDIQIVPTNQGSSILLFLILCSSTLVNLLYFMIKRGKTRPVSKEKILMGSLLSGLIIITCVPLMTNYLFQAGDLIFHLSRIEGIKEGLLSGDFPVRIQPQWLSGNGYATSIFYGDLFLYIPALLRLVGLPVQIAYKCYVVIVNVATCLISYYCFSKMFQNRYIGFLGSVLYSLSVYRIFNLYIRAAVGEYTAIVFLPLIAYGFFRLFTMDKKDSSYGKTWIPLVIGFTGIIQTHILTCEIVGLFAVILCLILWKKFLKPAVFVELIKAAVITLLVNLWFILPFLDYLLNGDFVIKSAPSIMIQKNGLLPTHLLTAFFQSGTTIDFINAGMVASEPVGIGISLILGMGMFVYLIYTKKYQSGDQTMQKAGVTALLLGCLALLMTLRIFPWDAIFDMNQITMRLVSSVQFPWRFLSMGTICLVIVTLVVMSILFRAKDRSFAKWFYAGLIGITLFTSVMLMNDILYVRGYYQLYNEESMGSGNVVGGEYLPTGTDVLLLGYDQNTAGAGVTIEHYEKNTSNTLLTCINQGTKESFVELSLLYYKGYEAKDTMTGELLKVVAGENNQARILLPAGYEGTIGVDFVSPAIWRAAEAISLIAILLCFFLTFVKWRKKGGRAHESI